jgi:hypothetical protein
LSRFEVVCGIAKENESLSPDNPFAARTNSLISMLHRLDSGDSLQVIMRFQLFESCDVLLFSEILSANFTVPQSPPLCRRYLCTSLPSMSPMIRLPTNDAIVATADG